MFKKRVKKKISPITIFVLLIVGTILLSALLSGIGKIKINNSYPFSFISQGTYSTVNSVTGELENEFVEIESLLNGSGLQYIISNMISNFISFSPLSMLIISLIGLSVLEKSGLIKAISSMFNPKTPVSAFTFIIIFLGVLSTFCSDIGYVIIIPLAALIFSLNKRNPIGGIVAAFAGIAGGNGINVLLGTMDINLSTYTTSAAKLLDSKYSVALSGNYFFIAIAAILITIIGTIITEKMIMPKLSNKMEETDELFIIEKKERRGLLFAAISSLITLLIFVYMIIPGLPFSGMLLDTTAKGYMNQLFGLNSYFQQGLVVIITIIMFVAGLFYGIGSGTIKNDKTVINFISTSLNKIGYLIILIFVASQFIAIFKKTNIGIIVNVWMLNILKFANISGLPLIMLFFFFAMIGNILLPNPTLKWSILSPAVVPLFMQSNLTPEFAQIVYRTAISTSNLLTPLLAYYVIYLGYLQIHNRKDETITIGESFKYLIPYCIIFAVTFLLLLTIWYIIGAPIAPGVFPTL